MPSVLAGAPHAAKTSLPSSARPSVGHAHSWPWCTRRSSMPSPRPSRGSPYGVPAFRVRGKTIAGFAAFKDHLSYLPHSGSVFPQLRDELKGYTTSTGALRFDIDRVLPAPLVEK